MGRRRRGGGRLRQEKRVRVHSRRCALRPARTRMCLLDVGGGGGAPGGPGKRAAHPFGLTAVDPLLRCRAILMVKANASSFQDVTLAKDYGAESTRAHAVSQRGRGSWERSA